MGGKKQHIRIEIDSVRPDDGARFAIDGHLGKEFGVAEREKDATMFTKPAGQVHCAEGTIAEFLDGQPGVPSEADFLERSNGIEMIDAREPWH